MTEDPLGEEIPELLEQLEGSLNAPDVEALHAVHTKRQAARKRTLAAAGAFVALLALTGGIVALNRDDTTSTVTADDLVEPVAVEAAPDSSGNRGAVAEDSAPFEIENLSSDLPGEDLRSVLGAQTWRVGKVNGDSDGFIPQLGRVTYVDDPLSDHGTLTYTNGCEGSSYTIDWTGITGAGIMVGSELAAVPTDPTVACVEATKQSVLVAGSWMTLTGASSSTLRMGTTCHPLAVCVAGGFWTVELIGTDAFQSPDDSELAGSAVVAIEECANGSWLTFGGQRWLPWDLPAEWEGQGRVDVTVNIDGNSLVATDDAGNSARFGLDDGTPRPSICNDFTLDLPAATASVPDESEVAYLFKDRNGETVALCANGEEFNDYGPNESDGTGGFSSAEEAVEDFLSSVRDGVSPRNPALAGRPPEVRQAYLDHFEKYYSAAKELAVSESRINNDLTIFVQPMDLIDGTETQYDPFVWSSVRIEVKQNPNGLHHVSSAIICGRQLYDAEALTNPIDFENLPN